MMRKVFPAVLALAFTSVFAQPSAIKNWQTPLYSTMFIMPPYYNNSCGLRHLKSGSAIFSGASDVVIHGWSTLDQTTYLTLPGSEYTARKSENGLEVNFEKKLIAKGKPEEKIAAIARKITLSDSEIKVDVSIRFEREIKYMNWVTWLCEDSFVPVNNLSILKGWTLECTDAKQSSANIYIDTTAKFDEKVWRASVWQMTCTQCVFSGNGQRIIFRALKNCGIKLSRYSADGFALIFVALRENPDNRPFSIPVGGKLEYSYSISFEK